ncbi:MAG: polyprenyl synthetase family protein [Aggregatilineaceae bacterium]
MTSEIPLQAVEELLLTVTRSAVPLLSETTAHILSAGGKRLRPRLVLLAHAAVGGTNTDDVIPLAAAVEIIHTATLVHDDINDHGTLRRGRETVNSRWGSTFALLTGDYMFTKTYEIMAPYPAELNRILSRAAIQLVEGETLQIQAARQGVLDRNTYYEIIAKKTAALFVACTELGATAAGAPPEWIQALSTYAFNLGLAFQIVDDILDLIGDAQTLGKNAGMDLPQGRGLAAVRDDGNLPDARTGTAVHVTPDTAGGPFKESLLAGNSLQTAVELGRAKAQELVERALASLDILPPSPALEELRNLARQVVQRDH